MLAVAHRRFNVTGDAHRIRVARRGATHTRVHCIQRAAGPVAVGARARFENSARARARRAAVSRASVRGLVGAGPRRHQVGSARGRAGAGRFAGRISREGFSARLSALLV